MRERFTGAMKEAMKAGDKRKLSTVRLIQAALKDKDIEARGAGKGQAICPTMSFTWRLRVRSRSGGSTLRSFA